MGANIKPRMGGLQMNYCVDLVFCIDATMSMYPLIDMVKDNALNFYQDFQAKMEEKHKKVTQLRIRVVVFRDYWYDKQEAMLVTNFFYLPDQAEEFAQCIRSIEIKGGGDDPEDGLEALAYAIRSDWTTDGFKRRHVIVVWSDAETHNLGFGKKSPYYPTTMPENFEELTRWWGTRGEPGYMDQDAKRLLIFAPKGNGWSQIADKWNQAVLSPSVAGEGLKEQDYSSVLDTICNSI